jgi:riboflavin synthase
MFDILCSLFFQPMFTGIVETTAKVVEIVKEGTNLTFRLQTPLSTELKIDQSVSHNGVCLTVTNLHADTYTVTAVDETLRKTNLGQWKIDTKVNLEQGHVDQTGVCTRVQDMGGSWLVDFEYDDAAGNITVEKGSICINGVSLTVFNSHDNGFRVTIIPYTYEHTNFHQLQAGDIVNLEFDILGKYMQKILKKSLS